MLKLVSADIRKQSLKKLRTEEWPGVRDSFIARVNDAFNESRSTTITIVLSEVYTDWICYLGDILNLLQEGGYMYNLNESVDGKAVLCIYFRED